MNESGVRSQYAEDVCEFVWLALAAYDRTQRTTSNIADWQQTGNEPSRAVLSAICEIASYAEAFAAESFIDHAETVSSMCVEPIPKIVRESVLKAPREQYGREGWSSLKSGWIRNMAAPIHGRRDGFRRGKEMRGHTAKETDKAPAPESRGPGKH